MHAVDPVSDWPKSIRSLKVLDWLRRMNDFSLEFTIQYSGRNVNGKVKSYLEQRAIRGLTRSSHFFSVKTLRSKASNESLEKKFKVIQYETNIDRRKDDGWMN